MTQLESAGQRWYVLPWAFFVAGLLVACATGTATPTITPAAVVADRTEPSPTAMDTARPTVTPAPPTRTPTPPTPTSTPTLTPTATPRPTSTPTPTPGCTETRGRVESGTFFSALLGQEQPYRVYLPPCYDLSDERYPVLYMLHGYPFDDGHWDEIGIDEAADAGISSGALSPFVIAMPSADNEGTYTNTSGGPGSFEAIFMEEFLPFIEARYRVLDRPEGRAIGGMSRGGVWSLEIAFRSPDQFTAVGGHSVALNVNRAPPVYDPLHLADDPALQSLRIYLDVGEQDWTAPSVEQLHQALDAAGVAHEFHTFPGHHVDAYWSEHVAEYLAFYAADW